MNVQRILQSLRREQGQLEEAISALERLAALGRRGRPPGRRGPGRPPKRRGPGRPPKRRGPGATAQASRSGEAAEAPRTEPATQAPCQTWTRPTSRDGATELAGCAVTHRFRRRDPLAGTRLCKFGQPAEMSEGASGRSECLPAACQKFIGEVVVWVDVRPAHFSRYLRVVLS